MKSVTLRWPSSTLAALSAVAMIAACTGGVGNPGEPAAGGSSGSSSGAPSSGTASDDGGAGPASSGPPGSGMATPESAGQLVMRRLTNREYSHIMADLLLDTTDPGAAFPLDGPTGTGFERQSCERTLRRLELPNTAEFWVLGEESKPIELRSVFIFTPRTQGIRLIGR